MNNPRGAFIVVEGLDGSGKTTFVRELSHTLQEKGSDTTQWHFPNRRSETGKFIQRYLSKEIDVDVTSMHYVFVSNFHEDRLAILEKLQNGVTVICDRYVHSGIAYSSAVTSTPTKNWTNAAVGLPAPDLVLYLDAPESVREKRMRLRGEEAERYEKQWIQRLVQQKFSMLHTNTWETINADMDIQDVVHSAVEICQRTMRYVHDTSVSSLRLCCNGYTVV